ncbi:MAG: helix-turn-helix domain-containing protein, partial [Victivallales bacterium]|nr:helix-turn-helix domain-containing protein [Victivallales bacterium]
MKYKSFMTGLEFQRIRVEKDLSQSEIASILGVSVVTVKSWEHERRNVP